jgi:YD repeat-containing protein
MLTFVEAGTEQAADLGDGDTVTYTYDALGRVSSRAVNGAGWTLGYDALGHPTTLTHALGTFTWAYVGQTGRLASLTYPTGMTSAYSYFGTTADRRLQTIHHRTSGGATLSKFDYTYDVVGNLLTWRQERAGQAAFQYTFTHDRVDQLLSAIKRSTDPTPVVLDRQAWTYDAAGNRTAAQQGDTVLASSFDSLNRLTTRQPGGPLVFEGAVSEPATVIIDGRLARPVADFHQRLTSFQHQPTTVGQAVPRTSAGRWAFEVFPQVTSTICGGAPNWHERGKIRIFGHDQRAGVARGVKDLQVGGSLQRQVADARALDAQGGAHPRRERRRQLVVEPDRHVTPRRLDVPGDGSRTGGRPTRPRAPDRAVPR